MWFSGNLSDFNSKKKGYNRDSKKVKGSSSIVSSETTSSKDNRHLPAQPLTKPLVVKFVQEECALEVENKSRQVENPTIFTGTILSPEEIESLKNVNLKYINRNKNRDYLATEFYEEPCQVKNNYHQPERQVAPTPRKIEPRQIDSRQISPSEKDKSNPNKIAKGAIISRRRKPTIKTNQNVEFTDNLPKQNKLPEYDTSKLTETRVVNKRDLINTNIKKRKIIIPKPVNIHITDDQIAKDDRIPRNINLTDTLGRVLATYSKSTFQYAIGIKEKTPSFKKLAATAIFSLVILLGFKNFQGFTQDSPLNSGYIQTAKLDKHYVSISDTGTFKKELDFKKTVTSNYSEEDIYKQIEQLFPDNSEKKAKTNSRKSFKTAGFIPVAKTENNDGGIDYSKANIASTEQGEAISAEEETFIDEDAAINSLIPSSYGSKIQEVQSVIYKYTKNKKLAKEYAYTIIVESLRNRLDPLLTLAIIKTESLFKTKARSHVGANGLMQIMPHTQKYLETSIMRIPARHRRSINNPHYNIKLGTAYIKYLKKLFKGRISLSLMAYNWGPQRVEELLRGRRKLPSSVRKYVTNILDDQSKWRDQFAFSG